MSEETETNPVGEAVAAGVEAETSETAFDNESFEDGSDGDEPEETPASAGDDEDELEHNGKKYRLPKAIIAERMMQQDYTKKTTDLAEQRKAFDAQRAQASADDRGMQEDYGKVHAIRAQLADYADINWAELNASDPALGQTLWMEREQLKEALTETEGGLQKKVQERLQGQRDYSVKAMQETGRVLSRDIKGWSPELANQIADYGIKEFGVKADEFRTLDDPRLWKLMHRTMVAETALKKQTAGERQIKLQATTPAKTVTTQARAAPTGLDDRLSSAEWNRRREAQVARRGR